MPIAVIILAIAAFLGDIAANATGIENTFIDPAIAIIVNAVAGLGSRLDSIEAVAPDSRFADLVASTAFTMRQGCAIGAVTAFECPVFTRAPFVDDLVAVVVDTIAKRQVRRVAVRVVIRIAKRSVFNHTGMSPWVGVIAIRA